MEIQTVENYNKKKEFYKPSSILFFVIGFLLSILVWFVLYLLGILTYAESPTFELTITATFLLVALIFFWRIKRFYNLNWVELTFRFISFAIGFCLLLAIALIAFSKFSLL
jgi:hypothetical protein